MKTQGLHLASDLARFVDSIARRGPSVRARRADRSGLDLPAAPTWRCDERTRRAGLLNELYRCHAAETAGANGDMSYRDTLPPDAWVNAQLAHRGEGWRVHNVDGFRCEIYDV